MILRIVNLIMMMYKVREGASPPAGLLDPPLIVLEALLQHPNDIVHGEAVQGGLDTLSHQPRMFHFFTETTNK